MKHISLTLDELMHYGTLGVVDGLSKEVAVRLVEYKDSIEEEVDAKTEDLVSDIASYEEAALSLEGELDDTREALDKIRQVLDTLEGT